MNSLAIWIYWTRCSYLLCFFFKDLVGNSHHTERQVSITVWVLELRSCPPTEWIWLSKMAQVGTRGLWRLRRCGCIADVGRSPWSEGCLASDCNLKRLLAPEDGDVHFVTWWSPWTALRWGRCERGLFPARAFTWSICGLGRLRKCRLEKRVRAVMLHSLKPCQSRF